MVDSDFLRWSGASHRVQVVHQVDRFLVQFLCSPGIDYVRALKWVEFPCFTSRVMLSSSVYWLRRCLSHRI